MKPSSVKVNKMRLSNKCTYTHKHALWSNFSQILTPGKPWSGVRPNTLPQRAKSDDVAAKGSQSERSEEEAILHLVIQPVVTRANSRSHTHTHTHTLTASWKAFVNSWLASLRAGLEVWSQSLGTAILRTRQTNTSLVSVMFTTRYLG